jgi:hypothetical protein
VCWEEMVYVCTWYVGAGRRGQIQNAFPSPKVSKALI